MPSTNVVRIPLLVSAFGNSTADASPSHTEATASGSMKRTASSVPLRAALRSRAAKHRE